MKIDYLEIGAVGPYPGIHKIDFSKLGDSALFLIDGPTGAGKTTIIDAIVFALFGSPAGADSDKFKLRSNHAKPEIETYVVMRFTVSAGTFEVRRTPQYEKLKADGSTTPHNATCTVDRINHGGTRDNIANQVKAAAVELQKLVGLEREQFRQTVVLPQGEFARFLTSESKDRRPILQRIFATERYERIEVLLKEMSKSARDEIESLKNKVHASIDTFKGRMHLSDELGEKLKAIGDSAETTDTIAEELANITTDLKDSLEAITAKTAQIATKFTEANSTLELRKKEADADEGLARAKNELEQAQANLDDAVSEVASNHGKSLRDVLIQPQDLSEIALIGQSLDSVNSAIADLQAALEEERKVGESQSSARELRGVLPQQEQQLEILGEQVQTHLPNEISDLENAVASGNKTLGGREKIVERIKAIEEISELQEAVRALTETLEVHQKSLDEAIALKRDAEDSFDQLVRQRFANFASELANELVPGEPCSVCGSLEHPEPRKGKGDLISTEMLEIEKQKVSRAEQNLLKVQKKVAEVQSELDTAMGKMKGKDVAKEADLEGLKKDLAELNARAEELKKLESSLGEKRIALTSAHEKRTSLVAQVAANKTALQALEKNIKLAETQINNFKHEFASVEERATSLDELKSAIKELDNLRGAVEQKQGAFNAATEVRQNLVNHDLFGRVDEAQAISDAVRTDLTSAQAELAEVKKKVETANYDVDLILRNLQAQIKKHDSSRALIKLSGLVAGNNQERLPLSTYVLTTLFEDVVDAANVRLAGMLEGRYSLATSEVAAVGNRRSGLDLVIHDARHDRSRLVSTLSGGERFCVSLALALGLAEIVQSNQGGISIDTLFIDEGFGTLDGSRLDDVMNVLSNLKKHGRTVGLISHVDSMKQQITEKITAIPDLSTGQSTLEVSWMN